MKKYFLIIFFLALAPFKTSAVPIVRADFISPSYSSFSFVSAVVIDAESGKELFSYNADEKRPAASLTKLLGAMVVLDSVKNLNKNIWLYGSDRVGGQSLNVKIRAQFRTIDLLYASLMYSANNAANALYRATGLSQKNFIKKMNAKAAKLGAANSAFFDLSGIKKENVTTAADMAKIARAAFGYKKISEITSMQEKTITAVIPRKNFYFKNTNKLVRDNDGSYVITGSKTGFLGENYVNLAVKIRTEKGNDVVVVVLGDKTLEEGFTNAKMLADWTWSNYVF